MKFFSSLNLMCGLLFPSFMFGSATLNSSTFLEKCSVASDTLGSEFVSRAADLCQVGRFDDAMRELESAMNSPAAAQSYTWYIKGFVFKEIFKTTTDPSKKSEVRDTAVEAFLFSRQLTDYDHDAFNSDAPLKYLIGTYYSDALMEAGICDESTVAHCDFLMSRYDELARLAAIDSDLNLRWSDYEKTIGMRLFNQWLSLPEALSLYHESLKRMTNAISNNPGDCISMYNLAVFHFKMSEAGKANKVSCDHEGELDMALSVMHKAESVCTGNTDILRGILNIYKMKQDANMAAEYEKRIAAIHQNPGIKN
jgi:tetratricopeptide (TPR) repeat protein